MHTQYNLILACGLVLTNYKEDENHLILHAEFKLKPFLLDNLKNVFSKITVVQDEYYKIRNPFSHDLHICGLMSKSKEYIGQNYENVFLTQENYWDTLLLSKMTVHRIIDIEEDIYFSSSESNDSSGKVRPIKQFLRKLRSIARRCIFGKNKYYSVLSSPSFYGDNQMYCSYYVLFPFAVRKCIIDRKKEINEIDKDMLSKGIDCLYDGIDLNFEKGKYAVFFMDLIERYPNRDKAEESFRAIIRICVENNYHVLLKYHPRETNKIKMLPDSVEEIEAIIPAEKVLTSLMGNQVIVIGNMTTALNSSVKLGFQTISLMNLLEIRNESAVKFYGKIGIHIPKYLNDINEFLENEINKSI